LFLLYLLTLHARAVEEDVFREQIFGKSVKVTVNHLSDVGISESLRRQHGRGKGL
jgi:hypothetical protein